MEAARVKARNERALARRETTLAALEASLAERWDKDVETLTARRKAFDAAAAAAAADLARTDLDREPQVLKILEGRERKREELREARRRGTPHEPISHGGVAVCWGVGIWEDPQNFPPLPDGDSRLTRRNMSIGVSRSAGWSYYKL